MNAFKKWRLANINDEKFILDWYRRTRTTLRAVIAAKYGAPVYLEWNTTEVRKHSHEIR